MLRHFAAQLRTLQDERGTEFIQFILTMPLLLITGLLIWQIMLIGLTFSAGLHVTEGAVRQYARCGATMADAVWWAHAMAPPGLQPTSVVASTEGERAVVRATFPIRTVAIPYILQQQLPDIPMQAVMRREACRKGDDWKP